MTETLTSGVVTRGWNGISLVLASPGKEVHMSDEELEVLITLDEP
jgi:hypothetical protein